ncbi:MAG: CHASE3 domain-containing protein, partial [Alphaproteobacteria bacterium]|nr:CHASE3 domain-containing protein [Alphaproteobacteria bacterium]
ALVDSGNTAAAVALVRSGEGLKTMNAIRERFATLKEVEARNLAARTEEASRAAATEAQSMYAVIAVGVAMLLVAALLMTAAIRGAIDERVAGIAARGQVRVIQSGKPSAAPPPTPVEAPRAETVRASV